MKFPGSRSSRRTLAAVAAATVLTGVTACSSGDAAGDDLTDISLITPVIGPVLDPGQASSAGLGPILMVLEPLVRYQDGAIEPLLASTVETPNPTTYEFTIRPGVSFSDGTPFTAEDAAFSLNLHLDEKTASVNASLFALVQSVEVTGEDQVTVTLAEADPQFLSSLAQIGMVSAAFYGEHGDQVGTQSVLNIGTGPYVFSDFTPLSSVTLAANEDYWGEAEAELETVALEVVSDDAARLNALRSGEYDGILAAPLAQVDAIAGLESLTVANSPDLSVYKFNLNLATAPWDDPHLRKAFALALNREAILTAALAGKAELAATVVPESIMADLAGAEATGSAYRELADSYTFDLDAARAEMAKSSVPDGVEAEVLVTGSDPSLALVVQTAAQDLAKVGIDLTVREVDDMTYYSAVYFEHTTSGVSIDLFGGSTPDAANLPTYVLSGANAITQGGSGTNISDYVNPAVDALLTESRTLAVDDPQRGAKLLEALALAQADTPYVPIAFPAVYMAARDGLDVARLDTFWWMARWPELLAGG